MCRAWRKWEGFVCARILYIGQECSPGIQSLPVQPRDKLARTGLSKGRNKSSPMDVAFKECVFSSNLKSEFSKPCGPDMEQCFGRQIASAFLLHRSRESPGTSPSWKHCWRSPRVSLTHGDHPFCCDAFPQVVVGNRTRPLMVSWQIQGLCPLGAASANQWFSF